MAFVNLDAGAPSLTDFLGEIPAEIEAAGFRLGELVPFERRDYTLDANWKVYVDNYLEGYHIPMIHPALHRELDYQNYRVDAYRYHASQIAPLRASRGKEDEKVLYYWVFPNIMLNFYPGSLQANAIVPLTHEKTLTIFEWYGLPEEDLEAAIAFSHQVQLEDVAISNSVAKGIRSRSYDRGRLNAKRENGVHFFHSLLHEHLIR
jgi:choline monooxygenase